MNNISKPQHGNKPGINRFLDILYIEKKINTYDNDLTRNSMMYKIIISNIKCIANVFNSKIYLLLKN